jgi:RimJ/RimL family protein N-acetyltransferase
MDVPAIRTPRLELLSMTPAFMSALRDGRREEAEDLLGITLADDPPDASDVRFLSRRIEQVRHKPEVQRWLARAIVLRTPDRLMVGNAGFHGEPGVNAPGHERALEIGYRIAADYRGQGYATEAVAALVAWARTQGIDHFVASVGPYNGPSLAIVQKLGFARTGEHWDDEDGLEHEFELRG